MAKPRIVTHRLLPALLLLVALFYACAPDDQLDTEAVKQQIERIRERADFPSTAEIRRRAEEEIARLPPERREAARRELEDMLERLPTEAQMDSLIAVVAEQLPSEAETDQAIDRISRELPSKAVMKRAIDAFINRLPENEELGDLLKTGLSTFRELLDSARVTEQ